MKNLCFLIIDVPLDVDVSDCVGRSWVSDCVEGGWV